MPFLYKLKRIKCIFLSVITLFIFTMLCGVIHNSMKTPSVKFRALERNRSKISNINFLALSPENVSLIKKNQDTTEVATPLENKKNRTLIIFWTRPWNLTTQGFGEGHKMKGCIGTYNRSKLPEASAVVFHYTSLDKEIMPWKHYRDPEQVFVFYSRESPSHIQNREKRYDMKKFDNNFINWTLTHRRDSDVFYPYPPTSKLSALITSGSKWVTTKLFKKKKMALWMVSNCENIYGASQRMKYVDEMIKGGLIVDRYGRCFQNQRELNNLTSDDLDQYRFYLAFENSRFCKDYVTEKFWKNSILSGRVPVVWGPSKEDIRELAPTGSFIHADDFETPYKLTQYLLYLNSNETAYRKYFKWIEYPDERTKLLTELYKETGDIKLCRMLLQNQKHKFYHSISEFQFNESKECLRKN